MSKLCHDMAKKKDWQVGRQGSYSVVMVTLQFSIPAWLRTLPEMHESRFSWVYTSHRGGRGGVRGRGVGESDCNVCQVKK